MSLFVDSNGRVLGDFKKHPLEEQRIIVVVNANEEETQSLLGLDEISTFVVGRVEDLSDTIFVPDDFEDAPIDDPFKDVEFGDFVDEKPVTPDKKSNPPEFYFVYNSDMSEQETRLVKVCADFSEGKASLKEVNDAAQNALGNLSYFSPEKIRNTLSNVILIQKTSISKMGFIGRLIQKILSFVSEYGVFKALDKTKGLIDGIDTKVEEQKQLEQFKLVSEFQEVERLRKAEEVRKTRETFSMLTAPIDEEGDLFQEFEISAPVQRTYTHIRPAPLPEVEKDEEHLREVDRVNYETYLQSLQASDVTNPEKSVDAWMRAQQTERVPDEIEGTISVDEVDEELGFSVIPLEDFQFPSLEGIDLSFVDEIIEAPERFRQLIANFHLEEEPEVLDFFEKPQVSPSIVYQSPFERVSDPLLEEECLVSLSKGFEVDDEEKKKRQKSNARLKSGVLVGRLTRGDGELFSKTYVSAEELSRRNIQRHNESKRK